MATRFYTALLYQTTEGYDVVFPDLPGCVSAGDTVEEAALGAEEALAAHIDLTLEHGETIPPPRRPEEIPSDPMTAEAARFLVRVMFPAKAA
jgi:predicted RNase H-like HicB family nuclease